MSIDQENEYFTELGLVPENLTETEKQSMRETLAFAFHNIDLSWIELKNRLKEINEGLFNQYFK